MCEMERCDTTLTGTLADVQYRITAEGQLILKVPGFEIQETTYAGEGKYSREAPYRGPALVPARHSEDAATVTVTLDGELLCSLSPWHYVQFRVKVAEERRLHFLVYGRDGDVWTLSCGGRAHCWWCRADDDLQVRFSDSVFPGIDLREVFSDEDDPGWFAEGRS